MENVENNNWKVFGDVHKVRHAIFGQFWPPSLLSHFATHPGTPQKVRHTSGTPRFLVGLKIPDKSPLYKFYLNCSRRFLSEGFVRVGFCPFPFCHAQYICYNRKLNITLNFMFHMYDNNLYKRDVTCSWHLPLSQTVTPSRTSSPSSVTYFMDGPFSIVSANLKMFMIITWWHVGTLWAYIIICISVTSHALDPSLCHKLSHLLEPPPPRTWRTLWTALQYRFSKFENVYDNYLMARWNSVSVYSRLFGVSNCESVRGCFISGLGRTDMHHVRQKHGMMI